MEAFIKPFSGTRMSDIKNVGGKNASIGELMTCLTRKGIQIPDGFSITAEGFKYFMEFNGLQKKINDLLKLLDKKKYSNLEEISNAAKKYIYEGTFPDNLKQQILIAYQTMGSKDTQSVAVRSSATAEDLPAASFAGQHDSFLNIRGSRALFNSIKLCYASLYNARAIKYRDDHAIKHKGVLISVGIQIMIDASTGSSGIGFTLDPESGFKNVIHISGSWGLGENIVQGNVTPDEFIVFKTSLLAEKQAVLAKVLGTKSKTMWYGKGKQSLQTINKKTRPSKSKQFVLSNQEITTLASWMAHIEAHFGRPMDVEWAKNGYDGQLFILQARPETVHSNRRTSLVKTFKLLEKGKVLIQGKSIGRGITTGKAKILKSPADAKLLKPGDILITDTATPDWDPIMKRVAGIVTNTGGRTSHAAIVARELGLIGVFGTGDATAQIRNGDSITICCTEGETGSVYKGKLQYKEKIIDTSKIVLPAKPQAKFILSEPERSFSLAALPNHGVGLLRIEFIISTAIGIHPMAIAHQDQIEQRTVKRDIANKVVGYSNAETFFIEKLASGIAMVAAAFYPKEVIVRFSDFKSSEYRLLIGGELFEPDEENPMLGFRGASRYYHDKYRDGFRLECLAVRRVREEMGLMNVKVMIPFCRTAQEGKKVIEVMKTFGLERGKHDLEIYVMAELPSNMIEVDAFAQYFDGFSIGSNDLTQLTLGVDRDSELLADLFSERDPAVQKLISNLIRHAKTLEKKVGLCGQAASDSADFVGFLVRSGIDSISFNPDAIIQGISLINQTNEVKKLLTASE